MRKVGVLMSRIRLGYRSRRRRAIAFILYLCLLTGVGVGLCVSTLSVEASVSTDVKVVEVESIPVVQEVVKQETSNVEEVIEVVELPYSVIEIPKHEDFKSYMPYTALTLYSQKELQDIAYNGDYGIRMVDGRYCVAVGTACNAKVGDYIVLVLENGVEIDAIVGDIKDGKHTDSNNLITSVNDCCSEFIVNTDLVESSVLRSGSISNCCEEWKSPVVKILVYGYNYFN